MKITKEKGEFGLNVFLEENNTSLAITYGGNGDLYWSIKNYNIDDIIKYNTFIITKENYGLFCLFVKLYNDIKEINIFEDIEENKELYQKYNYSNYHELFNKETNTITWYSDETNHEVANYLKIKKEEDSFKISFYTQKYIDGYDRDFASTYYIPVRFRNSGSRYYPFNIVFMKMYQYLNKIEDVSEFGHQIHIEEYLYEKEKVLKKV